jgi:hypothetical protein
MYEFKNPSLVTRIAIGKGIGLIFGLIGFVAIPVISPDMDPMLRWGFLFWYITVGAIVGMMGVMNWHPFVNMPLPWWFRGPWVGGWMNFVLVFFAYDALAKFTLDFFGPDALMQSPFWFVSEGIVFGLIVSYVATRYGGEGREAVDQPA